MDDAIKWLGLGVVGYFVWQAMSKPGAGAFSFTENTPSSGSGDVSTLNPFGGTNPGGFSATPPASSQPISTTVINSSGPGMMFWNPNPGGVAKPDPSVWSYSSGGGGGATSDMSKYLKDPDPIDWSPATGRSAVDAKPDVDVAWWTEWERTNHCRAITGAAIMPPPPGC